MKTRLLSLLVCMAVVMTSAAGVSAEDAAFAKGSRICLVGNALGERMQHHNHFETLLHAAFADNEYVVRNLCFPGDEVSLRIRSENFGSPDEHLTHSKADVILYFFGFNESFGGAKGVATFKADLANLIKHNLGQKYNGKSAPRIVLVSPIAAAPDALFTDTKPDLNENLKQYTDAMRDVAKETGVGFADLYMPTKSILVNATLSATKSEPLTRNGVHLTDAGYRVLAPVLFSALFPDKPAPKLDAKRYEAIRTAIADKSFHWWHRYRAVNGYSIYGPRGKAGRGPDGHNNTQVMERELEILDVMAANRDRRIWAIAAGKQVPAEVDDSNTPPFIEVISNIGDGKQKAKLGELQYQSPEESQKQITLAEGYEISLFASEVQFSDLINPVAINFDNKGRLWVSTMPSYPHWQPKTKMDDKVLILEDTDGDGKADRQIIFARGLHQPTGFEIGRGGAYIAEQPDVIFAKDTNGDGVADTKDRVLFGFDSADTHHGLAAFTWGPGGALYLQEGTFKFSALESPYGPQRMEEAGIWRFDPRTHRVEPFVSFRFSNPWGHVFDRWGQSFISDASPGFQYWATPISGAVVYPDKHLGGRQDGRFKVKKTDYPQLLKKRVRPTSGNEIVSSRQFPPEAQGNYLVTNVIGFRGILQHTMKEQDSGFFATEIEPLVQSSEGNFRPVDIQFGPDGALYICDWHNALIGHLQHNLRDPNRDHKHGRIWRVTYKGRSLLTPPKIDGAPIAELLELLKSPEDRTIYRARRELAERDSDAVIKAVTTWTDKLDKADENHEHHLLEALWQHQTHNRVNESLLNRVLASTDHRARAAAVRVLC